MLVFALFAALFANSCSSKPTDTRTAIPADALVYLETHDLGRLLSKIADNEAFRSTAASIPDLSPLNGIRLSAAVTGFETAEQAVTEENAVLNFQPRFVVVAETNAWNYQANAFAEHKLGEFVNNMFGGDVELESYPKNQGRYYQWTSPEGRRSYAFVEGSLIYFGNDESAIEKCIAAKRGETENIAKDPKVASLSSDSLAAGYISQDGIAQISNIAGVSFAVAASEDGDVRSFVARVLPEILRNSVTDITWNASGAEQAIEDRYDIGLNQEIAAVLNESLIPGPDQTAEKIVFSLPANTISLTRYDIADPVIGWRSLLATSRKVTDTISAGLITVFSAAVFEPYGVEDPELFLSSVGPVIYTAAFDTSEDSLIVIATVKDRAKVKASLAKELNVVVPGDDKNAETLTSAEQDVRAIFYGDMLILGSAKEAQEFYTRLAGSPADKHKNKFFTNVVNSKAIAATASRSADEAAEIARIIAGESKENKGVSSFSYTETKLDKNKIERRTVSDFGLAGMMIRQFGKE